MADKEQELLSVKDKSRLLDTITPIEKNPIYLLELIDNTEAQIVANLKAMDYVKWDKEKMAQVLQKYISDAKCQVFHTHDNIFLANQLYRELTGGE